MKMSAELACGASSDPGGCPYPWAGSKNGPENLVLFRLSESVPISSFAAIPTQLFGTREG
jgi:hypothetical protein